MDLADVVRRHGPAYLDKIGARMPAAHRQALAAIVRCHTPACGGSLYVCDRCGGQRFAYHRCGHRACGQCGFAQGEAWRARQGERLLPLTYFLVTCTIPEELRALFRRNQQLCYGMLMQESAAALQDVARQPRYLGGELGLLGVLHTWSRQLVYHPHVHYLVPGVARRADGTLCFPKDAEYLLPVQRVSARLRSRIRQRLRTEAPELYTQVPSSAWRQPWVLHCKSAGHGAEALSYLSRYIYKTALSSARLLHQDEHTVSFSYRESGTGQERTCTFSAAEFLRRFLQHVLPKGFHRVRHSGWLSPAAKTHFQEVATLLDAPPPPPRPATLLPIVLRCPHCQSPLRRIASFGRAPP
jgi:Putative transposase/Transposase zinc-binding domain